MLAIVRDPVETWTEKLQQSNRFSMAKGPATLDKPSIEQGAGFNQAKYVLV